MGSWCNPFTSLDGNAVTGFMEGDEIDLHAIRDRHAINVSATWTSGSPVFTFQLQGQWGGGGWTVLAELDQTHVDASGVSAQIVVDNQPAQRIKAVLYVTSGSINPRAVITSEE